MLNMGAAKADLFRWLYLNIKGGIYCDIDMVCKDSLRNYIKEDWHFASRILNKNSLNYKHILYRLNHGIIVTIPKNDLLSISIDNAISNILILYKQKKDEFMPQDVCGPTVIGKTLNLLLGKSLDSAHTNYKNNKLIPCEGKLKGLTLKFLINKIIKKMLIRKYPQYLEECEKIQVKRFGIDEPAFSYKHAEKYIKNNKVVLDYSLMKDKYF